MYRRSTYIHNQIATQVYFLFLLGFLLFFPENTSAATYYVDAESGKDIYSGLSTSAPWKTIDKVNRSKFRPGDYILFKKGCTWREQLIISSDGSSNNPITFGAYGTGDKPVITGANKVDSRGWTLYSGNIYVTSVSDLSSPPSQLYIDGEYHDIAHYPNSGWLTATEKSSDTTSIIDAKLNLPTDKIVGSEVMVKAVKWNIKTLKATSYDPATHRVTLDAPVFDASRAMYVGFGFYLRNMLWMLDSPGEWYYDKRAGKLYLWIEGGDSPSGYGVEISTRTYGILSSKKHITIENLAVTKANLTNVYIHGSDSVDTNNLEVSGGQLGIFITTTSNSSIRNNSVRNTLGNGIQALWGVDNISITNNIVNNAGSTGVSPKGSNGGIRVTGTDIIVSDNTITNSGNNGIMLGGEQIVIRNNVIDRSCLVVSDCAGIYTSGMGIANNNKTITGNTVTNTIGNISGTPIKKTQAHGIYLDDGTHDTKVLNNNISVADHGIFIHTGHNNIITGNTVYGARSNALYVSEAGVAATSAGAVHDNIITDNTFETVSTDQPAKFHSTKGSTLNFGSFDDNLYCHPNSAYVVRNQKQNLNLPDWQHASAQDLHSTDIKGPCSAPMPTVKLSATPSVATSGNTTLTWSSTNSIICNASGAWSGLKPVASSLTLTNYNEGGTYTLVCSGRGGKATASVIITANSVPLAKTPKK